MSHPRETKGMVLMAGPFLDNVEDKTVLGKMVALYKAAGTRFFIEVRDKLRSRQFYLWRDKAGYRSGKNAGRDPVAEGKRTGAQVPRGKRYAAGPVRVASKPIGGTRSTNWTSKKEGPQP